MLKVVIRDSEAHITTREKKGGGEHSNLPMMLMYLGYIMVLIIFTTKFCETLFMLITPTQNCLIRLN